MGKIGLILLILTALPLLVGLQAGAILVLFAMLPSIIAFYADHSPLKDIFKTVLACNAAAVIPHVVPLFFLPRDGRMEALMLMAKDWHLGMWIAAASLGGWGSIFVLQTAIRFILIVVYDLRATYLEKMQEKLLAEWGELLPDGQHTSAQK